MNELAERVLKGERRAASRLLSQIENDQAQVTPRLKMLYRHGRGAHILGVTGPPGSGKSTLVDLIIQQYRSDNLTVAVLAVDPCSPLSAGAVLGDRVRMNGHAEDEGVYIRSMSTRGALGGLSVVTADALIVLDGMGFDRLIVETVGVGQSETDIMSHADTVVVIQTPHAGDEIQTIKAGVLEIADILVVNKIDTGDAHQIINTFKEITAHRPGSGWTPSVVKMQATNMIGLSELIASITAHQKYLSSSGVKRRRQMASHVASIGEAAWRRGLDHPSAAILDYEFDEVLARRSDPYSLAEAVAQRLFTKDAE